MMETEQTTGSCPASSQTAVRAGISSSSRGDTRMPGVILDRFSGDGVRYRAKLIGVDPVSDSQGEKMCWDSMMKLKGIELATRKQGKHKQRVWLKVFANGLKILDERSGAVLHDHDRSRISSLTKDESDPRALAYIYQNQDYYTLFYIKMANLADPVLADIREVCQRMDKEITQQPVETPTQNHISLVLLNDTSTLHEESTLENVFSPRLDSSPAESKQVTSSEELMEVFSVPMREPMSPDQMPCSSPSSTEPGDPPQPMPRLSSSQILSMFGTQPVAGSPYSAPWAQVGPLGHQGPVPAAAPWPTMPAAAAAGAQAGVTAPPGGNHPFAVPFQTGATWAGNPAAAPATVGGPPNQPASPSSDFDFLG